MHLRLGVFLVQRAMLQHDHCVNIAGLVHAKQVIAQHQQCMEVSNVSWHAVLMQMHLVLDDAI